MFFSTKRNNCVELAEADSKIYNSFRLAHGNSAFWIPSESEYEMNINPSEFHFGVQKN